MTSVERRMEEKQRQDLRTRSKKFALRVIKFVDAMPNSPAGWVIGKQLVRCGTSVAANYRSACKARSRADFISKIGIVEEEADESAFWIELTVEAELIPVKRAGDILREANELTAIMAASRLTAKRRS
jgi:four helix bundle protein